MSRASWQQEVTHTAVLSPIRAAIHSSAVCECTFTYSRYVTTGQHIPPPQKCPFARGKQQPHLIHGSLDPHESDATNGTSIQFSYHKWRVWLNGRAFACDPKGRGLESQPVHFQVTALDKMLTRMCLCHQAV